MASYGYDDKEWEKREEKGYDEKSTSDPIGSISWAAFLIWAGVVLLLNNLDQLGGIVNFVESLNLPTTRLPFTLPWFDLTVWRVFFLGAFAITAMEILMRLALPMYRRNIVGNIFWAGILFGLAVGNWQLIWPIVLVVAGVAILIGRIIR